MQPFPFRTFDEIAELGLEVHVCCLSCHHRVGPIDLTDERLRGRPFTAARFVCAQTRRIYDACPPRVCGCLGQIIVRPRPDDRILPHQAIPWCEMACPRCVPHWEVSHPFTEGYGRRRDVTLPASPNA